MADLLDGRDGVLHERLSLMSPTKARYSVRAERAGQFLLTGRVEIDAGHEPALCRSADVPAHILPSAEPVTIAIFFLPQCSCCLLCHIAQSLIDTIIKRMRSNTSID